MNNYLQDIVQALSGKPRTTRTITIQRLCRSCQEELPDDRFAGIRVYCNARCSSRYRSSLRPRKTHG